MRPSLWYSFSFGSVLTCSFAARSLPLLYCKAVIKGLRIGQARQGVGWSAQLSPGCHFWPALSGQAAKCWSLFQILRAILAYF